MPCFIYNSNGTHCKSKSKNHEIPTMYISYQESLVFLPAKTLDRWKFLTPSFDWGGNAEAFIEWRVFFLCVKNILLVSYIY